MTLKLTLPIRVCVTGMTKEEVTQKYATNIQGFKMVRGEAYATIGSVTIDREEYYEL